MKITSYGKEVDLGGQDYLQTAEPRDVSATQGGGPIVRAGGVRINLSTPHLAPRTSRVKKCGPPGPEPSYLPHGRIPWDVLAGPGLTGVVDAGTRPS